MSERYKKRAHSMARELDAIDEVLGLVSRDDADTIDAVKSLRSEVEKLKKSAVHCKDCCCARSWKALGLPKYTGQSIDEHITTLRDVSVAAVTEVEKLKLSLSHEINHIEKLRGEREGLVTTKGKWDRVASIFPMGTELQYILDTIHERHSALNRAEASENDIKYWRGEFEQVKGQRDTRAKEIEDCCKLFGCDDLPVETYPSNLANLIRNERSDLKQRADAAGADADQLRQERDADTRTIVTLKARVRELEADLSSNNYLRLDEQYTDLRAQLERLQGAARDYLDCNRNEPFNPVRASDAANALRAELEVKDG